MSAIVINTRYDYHQATGDDLYYGTPADVDYLRRYPDAAHIVAEERKMHGGIQSGYTHYQLSGIYNGYTYDLSLNNTSQQGSQAAILPVSGQKSILLVVIAILGIYLLLHKKE